MPSQPRGSASFVTGHGRENEEEGEVGDGDKGVKRTPASHSLLLSKAAEGGELKPCGRKTQEDSLK